MPSNEEMTEVNTLLNKIKELNERGLSTHVVVIDFVFRNIQSLKDRVYLAYYYTGLKDPTREIEHTFIEDEVKARVSSILSGTVDNEGSPRPYSA